MSLSPILLTEVDSDLIGTAGRMDAMGILAIWSIRGRDLVPHLTEQTNSVRGFQILIEAYRLWALYELDYPVHANRLDDFFLLIEQAFARIVGKCAGDWPLPGARRVRARLSTKPRISLVDLDWHLLNDQKANGIWALYRGAAQRAGLLEDDMSRLSNETMEQANSTTKITGRTQDQIFSVICDAMDGTVDIPVRRNNAVTQAFYDTYREVPLVNHLHKMLIKRDELNCKLAALLRATDEIDHRKVLNDMVREHPAHEEIIRNVIRCEDLLSIVEAVFLWLCASRGKRIDTAVSDLPLDLEHLNRTHQLFGQSGVYGEETAKERHRLFCDELDLSDKESLAYSILRIHETISKGRGREPWVWEEGEVLSSDEEVDRPPASQFKVGWSWRNDYYLRPLKSIILEFEEVLSVE